VNLQRSSLFGDKKRMYYSPFTTKVVNNEIILKQTAPITFSNKTHYRAYIYAKAGVRISKTTLRKEKQLQGSEKEIIEQIHTIRFGETNPYVITGGHFYQLFVRNLGIFYNALLDPRIPSSTKDWLNRQQIALRTIALDLAVFALAGNEYTTIVPVQKHLFTCFNFYARPSDSLFAILYTLLALTDDTFITTTFPTKKLPMYPQQTKTSAKKLLTQYKLLLTHLLTNYHKEIINPQTGLVRTDILLASARDGIKRTSSFYDNVIAWATLGFAKRLGLYELTDLQLEQWRKRIKDAFWNTKAGIFLDDLSEMSQKKKLFSADSFIVLSTKFLDVKKSKDRNYLQQIVTYVKQNMLADPFPLHYSTHDLPKQLYRPVRHFAPSYMGTSIWSHWGMEYIKTLIYLGQYDQDYLSEAKKHLTSYEKNILQYGGYPEVYDKTGKILHTRFYRSVLHNGWVVNYEQAQLLFSASRY